MPPMTAVAPSVTWIVVDALCVLMGGVPWTEWVKSGAEFVRTRFMITVFAAVIWGVTVRDRSAFTNVVVTVLLATVCTGICTPWRTTAVWLFCVARRGSERMRPL